MHYLAKPGGGRQHYAVDPLNNRTFYYSDIDDLERQIECGPAAPHPAAAAATQPQLAAGAPASLLSAGSALQTGSAAAAAAAGGGSHPLVEQQV